MHRSISYLRLMVVARQLIHGATQSCASSSAKAIRVEEGLFFYSGSYSDAGVAAKIGRLCVFAIGFAQIIEPLRTNTYPDHHLINLIPPWHGRSRPRARHR